jgi:hypothetical protein
VLKCSAQKNDSIDCSVKNALAHFLRHVESLLDDFISAGETPVGGVGTTRKACHLIIGCESVKLMSSGRLKTDPHTIVIKFYFHVHLHWLGGIDALVLAISCLWCRTNFRLSSITRRHVVVWNMVIFVVFRLALPIPFFRGMVGRM